MNSFFRAYMVCLFIGSSACCKAKQEPQSSVVTTIPSASTRVPVSVPAKSAEEILAEKLHAAKTVENCLDITRPLMGAAPLDRTSGGDQLFALWASSNVQNISWQDFTTSVNETAPAQVRKNPSKESGKKLCVSGAIVQIREDKKSNNGLLLSSGTIYAFQNVGDSGTLTEGSRARMCGIVTGTYDYSNSAGGIGHAISLVGMWDVPENHK